MEESFRSAKNHRFGWSVLSVLSDAAERRHLHRGYQANTVERA
jgi:hypothetical protein